MLHWTFLFVYCHFSKIILLCNIAVRICIRDCQKNGGYLDISGRTGFQVIACRLAEYGYKKAVPFPTPPFN